MNPDIALYFVVGILTGMGLGLAGGVLLALHLLAGPKKKQ
jgi:hypothetical protein